jgi:DNA-binding SARP family transcriptional activator
MVPAPPSSTDPPHDQGRARQLRLDGSPAVLLHDGRSLRPSPRTAALLAVLAVAGPQSRDQLATLLHGHHGDASAARRNLRQLLFSQAALLARVVHQDANSLSLHEGLEIDLGDGPAHDVPLRPLLGTQAFEELPGLQSWLDAQRLQQTLRHAERLAAAASAHEAAGELAAALVLARQLVALQPASEHAHRRLMRLHHLRGDRAAALQAFDHCERLLKDELSVRPGDETLALLRLIDSAQPASAPMAPRPWPVGVLRPPRLIGRDATWQALHSGWKSGRASVITAEAGQGKTRLMTDLIHSLGAVQVAWISARPGDERLPLALLSRLLRTLLTRCTPVASVQHELARLLPELGDAPLEQADATPSRFANALDSLLLQAQAEGWQGLVLDDLHHADTASLQMLPRLMAAAPDLRWILAMRPLPAQAEQLQMVHSLIDSLNAQSLQLMPLDAAQVHEFVAALAVPDLPADQLAPTLHQRSGGNPLFLLESIKALWLAPGVQGPQAQIGSLPTGHQVTHLIAERLQRLSPQAVRLARCAAVAGQDFSASLAVHVLGERELDLADPWHELEQAQVLRDATFAHDLIHEAALASVPQALARQLHRNIAAFLQTHHSAPARVAWHWEQAQAWPEAGAAWQAAAGELRQRLQPFEQSRLLGTAADCFERAGLPSARFEALLLQAAALGQVNLGDAMLTVLAQAQACAQDQDQQLRAAAVRAELLFYRLDSDSMAAAQAGYDMAQAAGRTDLVVRCALPLAGQLGEARRAKEAVALLTPLRDWVHAHLTPLRRGQFESALALALDQANELALALPAWQQSLNLAQEAGDALLTAQSTANQGSTLAKMGRVREAVVLGRQGLALMRADDQAKGRPFMTQCTLGHRLRDLGHYDEALALLESAHAEFSASGVRFWRHMCADRLAQLWLQLGQPARAMALLADDADGLPLGLQVMRWVHRAELAQLRSGDALSPIRHAMGLIADRPDDIYWRVASMVASGIVPAAEAEVLGASLAAWATAHQRHGFALAGHVRAAAGALAQQAPQRALPHVNAALHLARQFTPDSFYLPQLWWVAAQVQHALGDKTEAMVMVNQGQAWIRQVMAEHLPAPFRPSFAEHNPVNRALLTWSA